MKIENWLEGHWALILGSSSGFGAEVSIKLSEYGVNIIGIHLDRKGTMKNVEDILSKIKQNGVKTEFFNINAADESCLLYTSPSPRDRTRSRMPSSA